MEPCTAQGHPVGMLDRDQRTAKMCTIDRHVVRRDRERSPVPLTGRNETISHRSVPGRTSPCRCKTRKNTHFWKSLHRLKHALIVGAYLSLVTFPSILSAPTTMSSRPSGEPRWLNPCGTSQENGESGEQLPMISDENLLEAILLQTRNGQFKANDFREKYVHKTFNTDFDQHHRDYKDKDYDWLPTKNEIPKSLDEPTPQAHLETLELGETLTNVHRYLQQIAVGLEQVVHDEKRRGGPFVDEFQETEGYLRSILCEVRTAIIEKDLPLPTNVTRKIMPDKFTEMDNTSVNMRNWIIFRDYMNLLEYIKDVFGHLKKTKVPRIG